MSVGRICAIVFTMAAGAAMADDFSFATRTDAMRYLEQALPKETARNPKYLTKADGTLSQWLTKEISFSTDGAGRVSATMREAYTQTKDGKTVDGKHEARFCLADVKVAAFSEPGDVTPSGEPSLGLLISCTAPGCVSAKWGDAASRADKTDVYIQDPTTRAKIVAAFRRLQSP